MAGKLKVVVYTPELSLARGLVALLASEGSKTHLFTSLQKCKEYLGQNRIDLLYVCIDDPNQEFDISAQLQEASINKKLSVLFHFTEPEKSDSVEGLSDKSGDEDSVPPLKDVKESSKAPEAKKPPKKPEEQKVNVVEQKAVENATPAGAGQHASAGRKNIKILLAEDDAAIANIIKFKLKAIGYEVIHAIDGQDAIDKTRESNPHLIILDVMMPKYTGTEVAKMLRMEQGFSKTPILIITASTSDQIEKLALKGGADRFLRKPFQMDKFVETIENLIEISRKDANELN